jgi:hypothetical protein
VKVVQIVVDGFVNIQLSVRSLYRLQEASNCMNDDLKGLTPKYK